MVLITDLRLLRKGPYYEVCSEAGAEFIAKETFLDQNGIVVGAAFDEDDFAVLRAKAQLIFAIRTGLDVLERKDRSKKELIRKLREKGVEEDTAQTAADYLEDKGYQNDLRYAVRLAELSAPSYGRRRVEELLFTHGIDRETARQALDEVFAGETAEDEKIDGILEKAAKNKDLSDPKEKNRLYAKLARLGFESGTVAAALRRLEEKRKEELL